MKINFNQTFFNLKKELIKEGDIILHLSDVCANALLAGLKTDSTAKESKAYRYKLALRIYEGGKLEVKTEDIVIIKSRVNDMYSTIVVGQVDDMLEGIKELCDGCVKDAGNKRGSEKETKK